MDFELLLLLALTSFAVEGVLSEKLAKESRPSRSLEPAGPWLPAAWPAPGPWAAPAWPAPVIAPWAGHHPVEASQVVSWTSPAEVAAAVAAARHAAAGVLHAQRHAQAAKEEVLVHQRLASAKEASAADTIQRSEAVANAERVMALAAAQAVVTAQARLAGAKARVAAAQRVAAARESAAAAAIHRNAHAAAQHLQRADFEAAKLSALQSSEAAGAAQHAASSKEALVPLGVPAAVPWAYPVDKPWAPWT